MRAKVVAAGLLMLSGPAWPAGDPARGASMFQACAACHSTQVGMHLTGPSLANVWGHKAGTAPGFSRYSDAMKRANIVWTEVTLDKWIGNPDAFVPVTSMTFAGLRESTARQDVIAYLKAVSEGKAPAAAAQRGGGMMGKPAKENLGQAPPEGQVTALSHCGDSYAVKTADGKVNKVWDFNLRFKTDSSQFGPRRGSGCVGKGNLRSQLRVVPRRESRGAAGLEITQCQGSHASTAA